MSKPTEYPVDLPVTPKMAERMRAAGWRPPARVITTVEELNALPDETVGMDARGTWFQYLKFQCLYGTVNFFGVEPGPGYDEPENVKLPATVIWEPEA